MTEHEELKNLIDEATSLGILIQASALLTDLNNQLKQRMTRNKRREGVKTRNELAKELNELM